MKTFISEGPAESCNGVDTGGPKHTLAEQGDAQTSLRALTSFVLAHPRLFVLTGAGISTASGIPDYRDVNGERKGRTPILLQEFLRSPTARRRYWARSALGWKVLAQAEPSAAHHALARLEALGRVERLVTQNVDGLHRRAGQTGTIELHGNISRAICVSCGRVHAREAIQQRLEADNPVLQTLSANAAPDGDAHLESIDFDTIRVPVCDHCQGMLKPDVVFFGEGVPRERVNAAQAALAHADAVLVVGSSLMVYSGYRFCVQAARAGKPIAAINLGRTRADPLLALKIALPCDRALLSVLAALPSVNLREPT
ncbi:NAD-dependent protein deacetylase [Mycetohabitans sp. B5]|nr:MULTISPECIES: NAD-dependent protein deacetylase [Mycetohabitans]MCG1055071.1 NAD-dependent protein deacetylase [Mycetohabitans sp. B5]